MTESYDRGLPWYRAVGLNEQKSSQETLSVNPDLLDGNINFQTIAVCIILGLGIVLCGYLLIYNVFYISVSNDVQFYGQLRTIGTTSRQIGKIISRQAMKIACFGIIAGLLGSFALSIFYPLCTPHSYRSQYGDYSGATACYLHWSRAIFSYHRFVVDPQTHQNSKKDFIHNCFILSK